jgi:uncharacterized protein
LNTHIEDPDTFDITALASAAPTPTEPRSKTREIFFGPDGLRAGWSLLLFIAIFAALMFTIGNVVHKLHHVPKGPHTDHSVSLTSSYLNDGITFFVVALVTFVMSKIERRPNSVYGLGGTRKLAHFFSGLASGIICLSLLVFTLCKTGLLVIDSRLLFGGNALRYGALWLLAFLLVGLVEEYLVRGYLQFTLSRGLASIYQRAFKTTHSKALGFWTSAILFSVLFGLGHGDNPGESPIGLLTAGLAAMVFCLSLWRTGSLWWAIGFHTAWDWSQSFLYGVADSGFMMRQHLFATHAVGKPILSGGATGPEGSIFILPTVALIALIIIFTLRRTNAGYTPIATQSIEL